MILKLFKQWQQRRRQKAQQKASLQTLTEMAQRHRWLDQLAVSNLIHWDSKQRRLFIEADLAALFINSIDRWTAFLHNVHEWFYLRQCNEAWANHIQKEELAAVRDTLRSEEGAEISPADIERIKRHRREEILLNDIEAPKVEDFEFFVIAHKENKDAAQPVISTVLGVGHYDPAADAIDAVATWEEVQRFLNKE